MLRSTPWVNLRNLWVSVWGGRVQYGCKYVSRSSSFSDQKAWLPFFLIEAHPLSFSGSLFHTAFTRLWHTPQRPPSHPLMVTHLLTLLCATAAYAAPCDIYGLAGTPCVGAYSLTRSLYSAYQGPLYQVISRPSNNIKNIFPLTPGGFVNASSQDEFCGVVNTTTIPPLGTNVSLDSFNMATYSFRHCDAQGFITPNDGSLDHIFTLVAGLNGAAGAVSFRSTNFPTWYIAPVATAEPGRLGLVEAPPSDAASWTITPAPGGGLTLTNVGRPQFGMGVGTNLTGACAPNYHSPSASVYLTDAPTQWVITPANGAETCEILRLFDQSPQANHLDTAPSGGAAPHPDKPVKAASFPITVGSNKAYGAFFQGGMGYRRDLTTGVAKGDEPETMYMVNSGKIFSAGCCFELSV